jgi:hypothetical protein
MDGKRCKIEKINKCEKRGIECLSAQDQESDGKCFENWEEEQKENRGKEFFDDNCLYKPGPGFEGYG